MSRSVVGDAYLALSDPKRIKYICKRVNLRKGGMEVQ